MGISSIQKFLFRVFLICCGAAYLFGIHLFTSSVLRAAVLSTTIGYLVGINMFNVSQGKFLSRNTIEIENWVSIAFGYLCSVILSWKSSHDLRVKVEQYETIIKKTRESFQEAIVAIDLANNAVSEMSMKMTKQNGVTEKQEEYIKQLSNRNSYLEDKLISFRNESRKLFSKRSEIDSAELLKEIEVLTKTLDVSPRVEESIEA